MYVFLSMGFAFFGGSIRNQCNSFVPGFENAFVNYSDHIVFQMLIV